MDFSTLKTIYKPDHSIWSEDSTFITLLKTIIRDELDETEKRILLIYAETASQRRTAKLLNVSTATINKKITSIREKIYDLLQHRIDSTDNGDNN